MSGATPKNSNLRSATPLAPRNQPGSPVRLIPGDSVADKPDPGIALCLSGGGYRAMLFHLGALWRLNELGYLKKLKRVSSVSGGSITAAVLALNWTKLNFDASGVGRDFDSTVVQPLRSLADRTIDIPAIGSGFLSLGRMGSRTAELYRRHLLGEADLSSLPQDPEFVLNATNLQSGVLWRFTKSYMRDYRVGEVVKQTTPLAVAVAASSAFPPLLSPVLLDFKESEFTPGSGLDLQRPPYTTRVVLTDGGVYDNLGLETAWKRYQTILVSDGGGGLAAEERPYLNWPLQAYRVLTILYSQVGSLRKRQVVDGYIQNARSGTYWGVGSHIEDYQLSDVLPCPSLETAKLAAVATRLTTIDRNTQERLINWGYAICDAGMRKHVESGAAAPTGFPYPIGIARQ